MLDHFWNERLAERNRVALQNPAAFLACRIFFTCAHAIEYGLHRALPTARKTNGLMQVAVHFDDALRRVSGTQMQAVDVLRDQSVQIAPPLELNERQVSRVGLGFPRRMRKPRAPGGFANLRVMRVVADIGK